MKDKIVFNQISPIYYQIKENIKKRINDGEFKPGSRISTEFELSNFYGVNRITIRRSLEELEREWHIYRKRGLGTFVTEECLMMRDHKYLIGLFEEMVKKGFSVRNKVLLKKFVKSSTNSLILHIQPETKIFHLQRLRYVNNIPYMFDNTYTIPEIGTRLINEDLENQSFYHLIEKYGYIPTYAIQQFRIKKTPSNLSSLIKIPINNYLFYSERQTIDQNNKVLAVSNLYSLDKNYSVKIFLKRRQK